MRLCRFRRAGSADDAAARSVEIGFYDERQIVPLIAAAEVHADATHGKLALPKGAEQSDLLAYLLPDGSGRALARKVAAWVEHNADTVTKGLGIPTAEVELLTPIPRPNKLFLLAGNYADHIKEGGGTATERAQTFPYFFMKPPSTTLTDPGKPVQIPSISPATIDWELELGVVIGRKCKAVKEAEALEYVAGYTVFNDISNRKFRPNPGRVTREKDAFFDWLHGKWFDGFCPCGPCVTSADAIGDPQALAMKLTLNGDVRQNATTGQMIFPVAALIEFISSICTLEPGDMISTGTPSGVGNATGTYLKPGDVLEATIDKIGTLRTPMIAEEPRA
ncbi:MAG: fumarylacetoacetate hydrolase family protein [Pirellulales bacterium]|nr:fumarylacetoacetate hydrolase family protein [Pirellulales bacterium]